MKELSLREVKYTEIRDLSRIRVSSSPFALFRLLAIDVNILGTFLLQETRIPLVHTRAGVTKTNEAAHRMNCRNRVNNFPTVDGGALQQCVVQMNEDSTESGELCGEAAMTATSCVILSPSPVLSTCLDLISPSLR